MDQSRYARCGGFKSHDSSFGYGGFDYGGFGNVGKYGGYRSSYVYPIDYNPNAHIYTISPYLASDEYVAPTWHKPTFIFAFFILVVLFIGLWMGQSGRNRTIYV